MKYVALVILFLVGSWGIAHAATSVFQTFQGGTATTSPEGILIGQGTAIDSLTIGSNLTLTGTTLSATGGGGSGAGTVGTSTVPTVGSLAYWTSNGYPSLLGQVATTTLTFSGPFTLTGTLGTLVGGTNASVTYYGLATTSALTAGNLLTSTGGSGVGNVATTTASCAGSVSCTAFTVIGAAPITITGNDSGTVTAVTGTYPIISSGGATPAISLAFSTTTLINAGTAISTSTGPGGAITINNTGVTSLAATYPLSTTAATGALTISSLLSTTTLINAGTGISTSTSALGAITITNTGVVSLGNGTGVTCTGTNPGSCSLASISAGVLGTPITGIPTSQATSTLYGLGTNGFVLAEVGGIPTWTATSSINNGVISVSCTTITCSGTNPASFSVGNNAIALTQIAQIGSGDFLGNGTGSTGNITALATSTIFGVGTNGYVLAEVGGSPQWVATTTLSTISGSLNLATQVTGTLPVLNGGTGTTTIPAGWIPYGGGGATPVYQAVATSSETCSGVVSCTAFNHIGAGGAITVSGGTNGQVLGWSAGAPTWVGTTTAGTGLTFNVGSPGNLSVNTSQNIAALSNLTTNGFVYTSGAAGTLNVQTFPIPYADGGTGSTTGVTGQVPYYGASAMQSEATGTISNGTNITVTNGATASVLGSNITIGLSGTVGIANGGTATTTGGVVGGIEFYNSSVLTNSQNFMELANGNIGIGTTTPFGTLSIATSSTAAFVIADAFNTMDALFGTASSTGSIFTVAATTSPPNLASGAIKLFDIDQYGHLTASSTPATPTISTCGTGSPAVTTGSTDTVGSFTTGTGAPTACTITFGSAFVHTPAVFVTDTSGTVTAVDVTSVSTTAFTTTFASGLTSIKIEYWVIQGPANL